MPKYRKKPVDVDAWRWDGVSTVSERPDWMRYAMVTTDQTDQSLLISGQSGKMRAQVGDWIVRGVDGMIYPVDDDTFRQTYDEVK